MSDHNLPIQWIEREIPDITKASGVRIEMVLQWHQFVINTDYGTADTIEWIDVPIIRLKEE